MRTLVKNGRVITAVDDYLADVLIDGETIVAIAHDLQVEADATIDASGQLVLPGGVDPHVHLGMPAAGTRTVDDFTSGTAAAVRGGTTTVIDFALQRPGGGLLETLDTWHAMLSANPPVIDVGFHLILRDIAGAQLNEVPALVDQGVTSFKLYMAYKNELMVDDQTIFEAMCAAGAHGMLTMMHAENGGVIEALVRRALAAGQTGPRYHESTRPVKAEALAVHSALAIAEIADAPVYIVHLSAEESLTHVAHARTAGRPAYAETCPQYLFLDSSVYDLPDFEAAKYVFTPPARARHHQDALWRGLAADDLAVVSTDHCPYCFADQKRLGVNDFSKIPNGGPGIESRLQLIHDGGVRAGRITLNRMVDLLSTTPARLFGLFPRKGTIAVGSDADIVIFDPDRRETLSVQSQVSRVDYCNYEGRAVIGSPTTVLSRGHVVFRDGAVVGKAGHGRFVKRARHLERLPGQPVRTSIRIGVGAAERS